MVPCTACKRPDLLGGTHMHYALSNYLPTVSGQLTHVHHDGLNKIRTDVTGKQNAMLGASYRTKPGDVDIRVTIAWQ